MSDKTPSNSNKRLSPWFLGALVLLLLTFLVLLQSSNLWKNLSVDSASDTLLLYALSSLNFVALVIFAFIFVRNLVKLSRERRALALGSKIKTRLLLYFFAVSFLPIIAMAFFSYLFMNRALDRWFTDIPENAIREARKVQNQSIEDQTVKLQETAEMLAKSLENREINDRDLQTILAAGNLTRLEILSKEGRVLMSVEKNIDAEQKAELEKTLAFVRENDFSERILTDGKGFDVAAAKFSDDRMLVIVPDLRPEENVNQMIESSLNEFEKLKQTQVTVRQVGLLTLGFLTFMLIFASSWTAFYIARGLTVPIKALAEGADEIARGNLKHRVAVLAEDELALLVSTFNQMSAKLEENSAELRERRKYIETVLQSLSTGVISFDAENRVTTINKAALRMLKFEPDGFLQINLQKLVNEENRVVLERLINRAKRTGQASEQTFLRREPISGSAESSESLPVALTATVLPKAFEAEDGGGVVLVIEDLSELIAAQRASAWSEVARRMAHEIKNPLTPIQLSAERIAKNFGRNSSFVNHTLSAADETENANLNGKAQLEKVVGESTETILREVNSLKLMVDEFSRFARLPNAELETGNLNEVVSHAVSLYEDRFADVRIELSLAKNLPAAKVDAEQMRRVFVNLIENAIEAFDEAETDKRIFVKTFYEKARDLIVTEIADNGGGIPPADFQKLFQPYFSTKGRGTGLGLAIVQRIVSEHHGKIKVVSNSPKGAKFIIELPVTNA